ncbi:MAG: hypothetical protein IPO90_12850 [Flavobacteriales bacterium]|nr:hypothetical protein [Flavobacteriales bacterium]
MIARNVLLGTALAFSVTLLAQSSGIRFIFPEFTKVYSGKSMWKSYQFGMGYDHDFNDRISMGLDAVIDLGRVTESDSRPFEVPYAGLTAEYISTDRFIAFTYRTAYSFSDNSEASLYVGSYFGVRAFTQKMDLIYVTDPTGFSYGNGPFPQQEEAKKTLLPIGLRLGFRGSLEGGFADLYTQLGYTIGGGESVFTQPYFKGDGFDLSTMSFTLGLAYGFGW